MKKIIHVIHGLSSGGAECLVKNYALNLDKKHFIVKVVCFCRFDTPYEKILEKNGIDVVYLLDKNTPKVIYSLIKLIKLRKIIHDERPDIIHTHLPINSAIKFSRPKKNTLIFHTVHNEPKVLWSKDNKKRLGDFKATKWLVRKYHMKFIVLHDEMRKEINKMFGVSDTIVLNNGIDLERFRNTLDGDEMRKRLSIPLDAFVIGHVGRFSEQKNQDFLVDVFSEIKKENKKAFLLMVGDGSDKKRISEKLDKSGLKGSYLILSNRDDVADLMSAMDVFVFPSRFEGLGIALVEAQERKLPCFISDRVPEHATISNIVTRLSLKDGAKKWADVILEYKTPKKIIINDRDWDIKKVTRQLEQIYLDALAERENGKK